MAAPKEHMSLDELRRELEAPGTREAIEEMCREFPDDGRSTDELRRSVSRTMGNRTISEFLR